jgi:hypothetical protein
MEILEIDRENQRVRVNSIHSSIQAGDYIGSVDGTVAGGIYANEDARLGQAWIKVFFFDEL